MTNVHYVNFESRRTAKEYLPHSSEEVLSLIQLMIDTEARAEKYMEEANGIVKYIQMLGDEGRQQQIDRLKVLLDTLRNNLSEIHTKIFKSEETGVERLRVKLGDKLLNVNTQSWSFVDSEIFHLASSLLHNIRWYERGLYTSLSYCKGLFY